MQVFVFPTLQACMKNRVGFSTAARPLGELQKQPGQSRGHCQAGHGRTKTKFTNQPCSAFSAFCFTLMLPSDELQPRFDL